jgi:hypothetical protein
VIAFYGLIGQLGRRSMAPLWLWGLLLMVALTAVHSVYWSNMRMRAPAMPIVYLLFAAGCRGIYDHIACRKLFLRKELQSEFES